MKPIFAHACAGAAVLFAPVPGFGAVPLFPVVERALGDVDKVGDDGGEQADDGDEYPALCAVEPCRDPASNVLAGTEGFDPICVGNAVVHPVGRGELVVPYAVVCEDGELGCLHAVLPGHVRAVGQGVDQALGEVLAEGALATVTHAGAGEELAMLAHAIRARGAGGGSGHARIGAGVVGVGQQGRSLGQVVVAGEVVVGGSIRAKRAEGGSGRGGCGAADGVTSLLLLEIGIVGVGMVVVDAAIGSHRLGHGRQAYQTGITEDAKRAFFLQHVRGGAEDGWGWWGHLRRCYDADAQRVGGPPGRRVTRSRVGSADLTANSSH